MGPCMRSLSCRVSKTKDELDEFQRRVARDELDERRGQVLLAKSSSDVGSVKKCRSSGEGEGHALALKL